MLGIFYKTVWMNKGYLLCNFNHHLDQPLGISIWWTKYLGPSKGLVNKQDNYFYDIKNYFLISTLGADVSETSLSYPEAWSPKKVKLSIKK